MQPLSFDSAPLLAGFRAEHPGVGVVAPGAWGFEGAAGALPPEAPGGLLLVDALRGAARPTALLDAARALLPAGAVLAILEPAALPESEAPEAALPLRLEAFLAEVARVARRPYPALFRRWQVGSVIQGYGLERLRFERVASWAEPDAVASARARLAAAQAALEAALPEARQEALKREGRALQSELSRARGLARLPATFVWGTVPATAGA